MKKIILYIVLSVNILYADECYEAYSYSDNHQVVTIMDNKISGKMSSEDSVKIDAILHTRSMENNGSEYTLFWLENGVFDKKYIDKNSIYSPFLIKNSTNSKEFLIKNIKSLTKDKKLDKQLIGLVELLQYKTTNGIFRFKNSMGSVEINQTVKGNIHFIKYLKQYQLNKVKNDVKYLSGVTNITLDKNCSKWHNIQTKQKIQFSSSLLNTTIIDSRKFTLIKSQKKLDKNHWFFHLSTDISTWGFNTKKQNFTKSDALNVFSQKNREMLALVGDFDKFNNWVKENMEFLQHLSGMLESVELDDKVSRMLFSSLGFIDNFESTNILSEVTLNENILEKERFRGLIALKDTSAPLEENILDEIAEYGLSSQNGDDSIKNAAGMIVGSLARNRVDRAPEQFEYLTDKIIETINTSEIKTVSLTAAGNMLDSAPDRLVKTVDEMILSTSNYKIKKDAAFAISRMQKTTLKVSDFKTLLKNEKNQSTSAKLIKASAVAKDFKSNNEYRNFLITIANNRNRVASNRIAALETLQKAGFGKNSKEKKLIRKMMLNENDSGISSLLKKLYRQ
jgi:hypothetical protein